MERFDEDNFYSAWEDGDVPMDDCQFQPPEFDRNHRNKRYSNAYGDYAGGYAPPPRFGGPPGPFGFGLGPNIGPRPMVILRRGGGPGPYAPPARKMSHEDRAINYLIRCGVAKENLKNLPRELLQLIEPQHCGICSQSFDSFNLSRIHYISRNHVKNQKSWLSKHSENPTLHKQVPLRARELYCELCDVQITSKAHADAHYAGKPHRAIVEGRKNPKNVMLLQKGMESRLGQLIRREKKFLKAVVVQDVQETSKDPKPVQPELYCEICKTSVTCTEQMTMHLNGKKHLSKEKQHILLKLMQGEINQEKEEGEKVETATGESGATGQEDSKTCEEDENNEGDYDWGNGSGKWDETADQN